MTVRDAIVIGSGPNGLAAAITLAEAGASVLVVEAHDEVGGGMRTRELTLPGFHHDVCSACHPTGILSPLFSRLPLAKHGLEWVQSDLSVAHPLDDQPAVLLQKDIDATAEGLGRDADRYRQLVQPFVERGPELLQDALAPLQVPQAPLLLARFGLTTLRSASSMARSFSDDRARALLAGCAGHATQPLDHMLTAAMTLVFLVTAHLENWPVARGGSASIARALASYFRSLGGEIETGTRVTSLDELPPSRVVLFDTAPDQLARMGAPHLPSSYVRALQRYTYGPGSFKIDWALDGPIPWADPAVARAATVHLGGTLQEIEASERAAWDGHHSDNPYVLLVQQSMLDSTRAPPGQHTGYAYCHVPHGSTQDMTEVIERQVERFAPGFRDRILARHTMNTQQLHRYSANYVGGAVTGGSADITQLFTRPVPRLDPYSTPNPRLFLCSASTPPGGGVHGMCGYYAARSALRAIGRLQRQLPMR